MSIEDRDYFNKDRAKRASVLTDNRIPKPVHVVHDLTKFARKANREMVFDTRHLRWPAFCAGLAVGVFGTLFVVGLLRL